MSSVDWGDIIDSVQLDRVLDELGLNVTMVVRGEHWASCPLPGHPGNDSRPSFSINEDTLLWNCFTCNEGGLLPSLVQQTMEFESWDEAITWLLPFADVDVDSDDGFNEQLERLIDTAQTRKRIVRKVELPYYSPTALDRYELCPIDLLAKWHIIVPQVVERYGIRYEEKHRRKETDYFGPAIIIPHWFKGELVGYHERWLEDERPKWVAKYTNSDEFPKAQTLFNFDRAIEAARDGEPVTVVEAALTVVRLDQLDIPAVATFGASITPEQFKLLATFPTVILSRDEDPDYVNEKGRVVKGAGVKAYIAAVEELSYKVDLYRLPENPVKKGDLADLDDAQVFAMYDCLSAVSDT